MPLVAVIMGSKSDWKTMRQAAELLEEFGVAHECRVLSAHRTPAETAEYVGRFGEPEPGTKVFIRTHQQRDGWKDMEKDLSEVVPVKAESESGEPARLGAREAFNESSGANQLHKLLGLQWLHSAGGGQREAAGSQSREGNGVRCTRGWFRIATASIPWYYRWGTRERWHIADGKWQIESVGGRRARRHWRELWHGS